jgi:hypothetical protein
MPMSLWFVDMNQRVKKPGSPWSAWAWAASAMVALLKASGADRFERAGR